MFENSIHDAYSNFSPDPSRLHEEYTRYLMYLQVKRDLCEGRLTAPVSTICLLVTISGIF
jgi:tyrosine-protein phosphatase non-receptor type 4